MGPAAALGEHGDESPGTLTFATLRASWRQTQSPLCRRQRSPHFATTETFQPAPGKRLRQRMTRRSQAPRRWAWTSRPSPKAPIGRRCRLRAFVYGAPGRAGTETPENRGNRDLTWLATAYITIGHSTRSIDDFIHLLKSHGVQRVIDVRTLPRSRVNPHFDITRLPALLRAAHLHYTHLPGLGGLKRPHRDSQNTAWRNLSFRGYADHMQSANFKLSLERCLEFASVERVALMCAEAVPLALPSLADRRRPDGAGHRGARNRERLARAAAYTDAIRARRGRGDHLSRRSHDRGGAGHASLSASAAESHHDIGRALEARPGGEGGHVRVAAPAASRRQPGCVHITNEH